MSGVLSKGKLVYNNILLVIPSWGKLLGHPSLGQYAHHNVLKISQDFVIFLGGIERAVITRRGIVYYLFGLGYYHTKFEVQSGRYIIDNKPLTGLLLSDFVYDELATSRNLTLQDDPDVFVGENVFKVPIDLSFKSENKKAFIQGTLMRNLFIPYKDIILEFIELIRDSNSYLFEKTGHMILSAHWDFFNQILISDDMDGKQKLKYLEPTAGINKISLRLYKFLIEHFNNSELVDIRENIRKLKEVYSSIKFDPMYLYSLIDQANLWIKIKIPNIPTHRMVSNPEKKKIKKSILVSAEGNLDVIAEWPSAFKRKSKKKLEDSALIVKDRLYHPKKRQQGIIKDEPIREEKIVPRILERPSVEPKPLPKIPATNINEILSTLKKIVEEDYDLHSIGKAFGIARDYIKSMVLHLNFLWDMSKYANIYQRSRPNKGLSFKEKRDLLENIELWIDMSR